MHQTTSQQPKAWYEKAFNYISALWTGADGRISLRASLAIAFSIDFISNFQYAIRKWSETRSIEGLSLVLGIEAGLIVSLLGITAISNVAFKRIESGTASNVSIQHAETVVGSSKAETVNAGKVDTVNTQTTNIQEE